MSDAVQQQTSLAETLPRTKAVVIIGPPGSGKSSLARSLATEFGSFAEIDKACFVSEFCLGSVLDLEPDSLILDELPDTAKSIAMLRTILCCEEVYRELKYKPRRIVQSPRLIICLSEPTAEMMMLGRQQDFITITLERKNHG